MVAEGVPQPPWALTFLSESKSESEPREIGGKQRKRKREPSGRQNDKEWGSEI